MEVVSGWMFPSGLQIGGQSGGRLLSPDRLRPVAGHVAVALDKLMVVWGGYYMTENNHETFNPPKELLIFDTTCDKWFSFSTSGDVPGETSGSCGVIVGTTFFVFGGFCDDHFLHAPLFALDLRTLIWRRIEPSSDHVPTVRHKLVGWHYNDKLYFFGGFGPPPSASRASRAQVKYLQSDSSHFVLDGSLHYACAWNNQLISFNCESQSWELLPLLGDAPSARAAHSAVFVPETSKVIVFGGRLLDQRMNDIYILDMPSMIWTKLETNNGPCGRSWHTTVAIDSNHMLLFGGFSQDCVPLSDTWLFNVAQRRWTRLRAESESKPRLWHTAVSIDGSCYAFGGCTANILMASARKHFANDITVTEVTPKPLFQLCLKHFMNTKPTSSFTQKKRLAQLPGPLCEKMTFIHSNKRQKLLKTPIDLLLL